MDLTLGDHKIGDLMELITNMNMTNQEEVSSKLDIILSPFSLFLQLNDEGEGDRSFQYPPTSISLPGGMQITDEWLDRTTLMPTLSFTKLGMALLRSRDLINWGVIQRPDRKFAFQFLTKRRSPRRLPVELSVMVQPAPKLVQTQTSNPVINPTEEGTKVYTVQ